MDHFSPTPPSIGSVLPPPLPALPSPLPVSRRSRLGWCGHLLLLTGWLLALVVIGRLRETSTHRHVPLHSVPGLLLGVGTNTLLFGAVCGAAWLFSRATAAEWRLRWRGGVGPLWRGVLYSVGFRITLGLAFFVLWLVLLALHVVTPQDAAKFQPKVENAISLFALAHDQAFYWCVVTILSASAGILEETWRGGMLAGLAGVFPKLFGGPVGQWFAVVPVAALFGLGHLYMGWPAVGLTAVLGLFLGAITVWHRTIWDAAIAHTLFDAGSFALLAWVTQFHPDLLGH